MKDKGFLELLGSKSYKEGNFFYDLHELHFFNKTAYDNLIQNINLYKVILKDKTCINKDIVSQLYLFMGLYIWTIRDFEEGKYNIKGIKNKEDLFDYYEELDGEIMLLFQG